MIDNLDRFALGSVNTDGPEPTIEENVPDIELTFEDYSRFKYGDGRMSRVYGLHMAQQVALKAIEAADGDDIYVTSSAYKIARPASGSLVVPFVWKAQAIARAEGSPSQVVPVKINRANLTDGDYADMSAEERELVMQKNGLSLPEGVNLEDAYVIALDDIRVTGSHEVSLDAVLRKANAEHVTHAYILDVPNGTTDPQLESRINGSAVRGIEEIIALASMKQFLPNARLAKRILTESPETIETFCQSVPMRVATKIIHDSLGDGLNKMERYARGFEIMNEATANVNAPNYSTGDTR